MISTLVPMSLELLEMYYHNQHDPLLVRKWVKNDRDFTTNR